MRYVLLKGKCQGALLVLSWIYMSTDMWNDWLNTLWILTSFYVGSIIAGNDGDSYKGILCLSCTMESYACLGGRKMINVHADECKLQEGPMYDGPL